MMERFGELRALVQRGRHADDARLFALVKSAYEEDPTRYADAWLPYLEGAELPVFRLNSPMATRIFLEALPAHAGAIVALHGTRHSPVWPERVWARIDALSSDRVVGLRLSRTGYTPELSAALFGRDRPEHLRGVHWSNEPSGFRGLDALGANETWRGIERLGLSRVGLQWRALRELLGRLELASLEELLVCGTRLDERGAMELADLELNALRGLKLDRGALGRAASTHLIESEWFKGLRAVSLMGRIPKRGATHGMDDVWEMPRLAEVRFDGLEELALHHVGMTDEGASQLARGEHFTSLRVLDVSHNPGLSARGVRALWGARSMPRLETLRIAGCGFKRLEVEQLGAEAPSGVVVCTDRTERLGVWEQAFWRD